MIITMKSNVTINFAIELPTRHSRSWRSGRNSSSQLCRFERGTNAFLWHQRVAISHLRKSRIIRVPERSIGVECLALVSVERLALLQSRDEVGTTLIQKLPSQTPPGNCVTKPHCIEGKLTLRGTNVQKRLPTQRGGDACCENHHTSCTERRQATQTSQWPASTVSFAVFGVKPPAPIKTPCGNDKRSHNLALCNRHRGKQQNR